MSDVMTADSRRPDYTLLGIGLYTPAEAERLIRVPASKLVRWVAGHRIGDRVYPRLWEPQVDEDETGRSLGFRDLVQARVAASLIAHGLSSRKVRVAVQLAGSVLETTHPFATARFRTDGRTLLLQTFVPGEDDRLIDLFGGGQYVMRSIIEPSLKGVEFDDDLAARWWPLGRAAGIVLDPARQFGRPIDAATGVPTSILALAAEADGSLEEAAKTYVVPVSAVRRAISYELSLAA